MQAFANNHFVCFSSQNLPYGGASDFVYGVLAYFHNIIKTRNILKNIPRFWYASSKHIPYSNKLPSQFVTNTPYVSPLKNCRTVVRQFLYYGVRRIRYDLNTANMAILSHFCYTKFAHNFI